MLFRSVDATVTDGNTYCYRVQAANSAGVSGYSNVACGTSSSGLALSVTDTGTGTGTVVSSPTGINCGTVCSASFASGAVVTLTATPAASAIFGGWSGSGCSGTAPCSLAGNGSMSVTANFAALAPSPSYILTVTKSGPGTASSSPSGITCGSTCSASYAGGTVITLTAVAGHGARFKGWTGGGCTGTGTCTVTLNTNVSVTGSFSKR